MLSEVRNVKGFYNLGDCSIRKIHFRTDTWRHGYGGVLHRGSYMSADVLLNLLNELRKSEAWRSFYRFFATSLNKFNNTAARMLGIIYLMTLKLLKCILAGKHLDFKTL